MIGRDGIGRKEGGREGLPVGSIVCLALGGVKFQKKGERNRPHFPAFVMIFFIYNRKAS